jgi:hypothetical protein
MYRVLLSLALIQACWALGSAAPRQIATSPQSTPTSTYVHETPLSEPTLAARTLLPRCDNPPCSYDPGPAETLQASVVTSTILSTTSVPCYITTYVTESTTTTETIYSTETITSTVTEKGTVYIIKYSPTPVIKSTVYENVIQITQTQTAMWVETEGEYYEETVTGDTSTVDGGTGGGYDKGKGGEGDKGGWKDAGGGSGYAAVPAPAASTGEWKDAGGGGNGYAAPASSVPAAAPAPAAQANAWTHASGAANTVATPVAGVNAAAGTGAGAGWSTAGGGVTIAGQNMANWHNGAWHAVSVGWPMITLTVVSIVGGVILL